MSNVLLEEEATPMSEEDVSTKNALDVDEKDPTTRKRQTRSWVWSHLTIIGLQNGKEMCKCNYCGKPLTCDAKNGTKHLQRHLKDVCTHFKRHSKSQSILNFKVSEHGSAITAWKFNQERSREDFSAVVVDCELPFRIVEHPTFKNWIKNLQPKYKILSRFTTQRDCLKMFVREKAKLKEYFKNSSLRICLTTDMWTSLQNLGYISITAHYIDSSWKMHKIIISFSVLTSRHTGDNIAQAIINCLNDWNIEKLTSITADNASTNDVVVRNLVEHYSFNGALLQNGSFFHVRCWAHILNLVVQDGLSEIKDIIGNVRNLVKYVKYSPRRYQEFLEVAKQEGVPTNRGLKLDVCTRWNSTYLMLQSVLVYQKVFNRMKSRDSHFSDALPIGEWKRAENVCSILENFHNVTKVFSGRRYSTANLFFSLIFEIEKDLKMLLDNDDALIKNMAIKMHSKFDKYWKDRKCMVPLAIATILDPRLKLQFLRFSYSELYPGIEGAEYISEVENAFFGLFDEYAICCKGSSYGRPSSSNMSEEGIVDASNKKEDMVSKFRKKKKETGTSQTGKSEIELYLEDDSADNDEYDKFNILKWWDVNSCKYRVLSCMARDILPIPVSTVASESAFSTGGRIIDEYRSNLSPETAEALVCSQDWRRDERHVHGNDDDDEDDEKEEEDDMLLDSSMVST